MKKYLGAFFVTFILFYIRSADAQQQTFGGTRINLLVDSHSGFVIEPVQL
jgi:hypothetical protein